MNDPAKPYRVISHDGWGNTCVGAFESLEAAQELYRTLCSDRWFRSDGSVRGLSLESAGATLETICFSSPDRPGVPRR
ncbi:MAG: hypothetical protein FJ054_11810 [Cyanobacteria bacterium M_surface_10_m2_119]|nr:hypothetical protein [Cyanobacteria bacterium M_surface_10_m2_119]